MSKVSEEDLDNTRIAPVVSQIIETMQEIRDSSFDGIVKARLLWSLQNLLTALLEYRWLGIKPVVQAIYDSIKITEDVTEEEKASGIWEKVVNVTRDSASLINAANVNSGAVRAVYQHIGWIIPAITQHLLN